MTTARNNANSTTKGQQASSLWCASHLAAVVVEKRSSDRAFAYLPLPVSMIAANQETGT